MSVFGDYANYYDLFYWDKDYVGESEYIIGLIKERNPSARTILDLGCGTGRHDIVFAQKGYSVLGVDRSEEMLSRAIERSADCDSSHGQLDFKRADICEFETDMKFDFVVSLFHVMSYLTSNEELVAAMRTANRHLNPGGLFIFDFWYGPGVLTTPPETRVKRFEDDEFDVIRSSEPVVLYNENVVEVHYHLLVREKGSLETREIKEAHRMRYLFTPELELMLGKAGFEPLGLFEFLTTREANQNTWNACMVARAL